MSRYVITITADNGALPDASAAQTVVRIDTSTGQARITEVTVSAANGYGLAPADLPAVDFDLLVRALTTSDHAQIAIPAPLEGAATAAGRTSSVGTPTRRPVGKAGSARAAAKSGRTAPKAVAAEAPSRGHGSVETGRRAYRRMPQAKQVMDAYRRAGTITGMAEYFDVPRHTAAGWARRLRAEGYSIGRH